MALFTREQICEQLGIEQAYITMNVKRGKIVLTDGKYIDDFNPLNAAFITKRKLKMGDDVPKEAPKEEKESLRNIRPLNKEEQEAEYRPKSENTAEEMPLDLQGKDFAALLKEEKVEKIIKTRSEREVIDLKKQKLLGENIPIASIKTLLVTAVESVCVAFEQELEVFSVKMMGKYGLSREEMADFRTESLTTSNAARTKAIDIAKKRLRKIQQETAIRKERGERG